MDSSSLFDFGGARDAAKRRSGRHARRHCKRRSPPSTTVIILRRARASARAGTPGASARFIMITLICDGGRKGRRACVCRQLFGGVARVRDVYARRDYPGTFAKNFTVAVPPMDAVLLKVTPLP